MPFPFSFVCDLLENLHPLHVRTHSLLPAILHKRRIDHISRWLKDKKSDLNAFNTQSDAALWMLRPDKLGDRYYGISAQSLQLIIARIYSVSREDMKTLRRWETQPHLGDFATCVGEVREAMQGIPAPTKEGQVTVEEIQNTMLRIASKNPESSSAVRSLSSDEDYVNPLILLQNIYERLTSKEAKWMTRYILKDYGAILLPDSWTWEPGHFGLPNCAPIRFDLFTQNPPVEILDGTRRVKATAATRAATEKERIETEGWSMPPRRSRPNSPIARPKFKCKQAPIPEPNRSRVERQSSRSRDPSPDSEPMVWQTGLLKPSAKRKRTEILSTPAQLPAKASSIPTKNPVRSMVNGIVTPLATPKQFAARAPVCSSAISALAQSLRIHPKAVIKTPVSLMKISRPSSSVSTPSIRSKSSDSTSTPIFIDLTESPPRSGCSTTTTLVGSSLQISSSPTGNLPKQVPSSAMTLVASSASINLTTQSRTALSPLSSKASRNNQLSTLSTHHLPASTCKPSHPLLTAGTGKCRITKHGECPLIRCIILLSLSLASPHHPLQQYLHWHGLLYLSSTQSLSHPNLPHSCPITNLRYRKIVLVDMYNPKETAKFLSEIENLELKHRVKRGKRDIKGNEWTKEYVEVYDWKILEAMGKVDQGKTFEYDPWERCLVLPV